MKKWVWFALTAILFFAVLLRVLPLTNYAIWGSDSGEYYYISDHIVNEQTLPEDYNGWGFGYPYFPGMFYLSVVVSEAAGLDLLYTLLLLTPILASFSTIVLFMLTKRIGGTDTEALIAAGVLTVAMPHVITTSHPMPGALADMFLILCLLLLLKSYNDRRFFLPLIICTFGLIMIHHLTTFMLMVSVLGIVIIRELFKHPEVELRTLKLDLLYLFILITGTLVYWFAFAVPFAERVILENLGNLSAAFVITAFYLGFACFAGLLYFSRKHLKFRYRPTESTRRRQITLYFVFLIISLSALIASTKIPFPPMETTPDPLIILYLLPLFVFITFSVLGPKESELRRGGIYLIAWMTSICLLAAVSVAVGSKELLIYRLFQYLWAPWAVLAGFGFVAAYKKFPGPPSDKLGANNERRSIRHGMIASTIIIILIVAAGATAIPPKEVLANFQEGITHEEMDGVYWCRDNLENGATIASDHRLSSMLFGFGGVNASWDYVVDTFYEDTFEDVRDELNQSSVPSGKKRIDYVMLSDELKAGVALYQNREAAPMSSAAIAKFEQNPFYKIYESNGVEIYVVDWEYS